jgi:hypothetical protein
MTKLTLSNIYEKVYVKEIKQYFFVMIIKSFSCHKRYAFCVPNIPHRILSEVMAILYNTYKYLFTSCDKGNSYLKNFVLLLWLKDMYTAIICHICSAVAASIYGNQLLEMPYAAQYFNLSHD